MGFLPVPSESQIDTALRSFIMSVLPANVNVIRGQDNRVPEPFGTDFVVMTTIRRERIETNVNMRNDCSFTASISGTALTVTASVLGLISVPNALLGTGVAAGTMITAQTSGAGGGPGTYTVDTAQTVASGKMACGTQLDMRPTDVVIQLDVHGPNSADNAQTIVTLLRDGFGVAAFNASGFDIAPLYADDPKQVPFLNAEQQFETRYIIEARLQANQIVAPPQDYADQLQVALNEVL